MKRWLFIPTLLCFLVPVAGVQAGEADVVGATVKQTGERTYRFDVAVGHADTGWDHYADTHRNRR